MKLFQIKPALFSLITAGHRRLLSTSLSKSPHLAATLYRELTNPSNVSEWSSVVRELARDGQPEAALRVYSRMTKLSLNPNNSTLPCALKSSATLADIRSGTQLHNYAFVSGLHRELFVSSALIALYANCGRPEDARQVFDEITFRNIVSWTALMHGYAQNGLFEEALMVYKEMKSSDGSVQMDSVAMMNLIASCAELAILELVMELHGVVIKCGFEYDVCVNNSLLEGYLRSNGIFIARQLFDEIPEKDVVSYNTMIASYAQHGFSHEALSLVSVVIADDQVTFTAATLSSTLLACAHAGALRIGKSVHARAILMELERSLYIGTSLIDMYCKCGRIDVAKRVFDQMEDKNIKTWTAMLSGYGMHGLGREALEVFHGMQMDGFEPNYISFVAVLAACSHAGLVDEGLKWFRSMSDIYGITPGLEHYTCMVDLLGRVGRLEEAYNLVQSMRAKPDFIIWGALLAACKLHKNVNFGEIAWQKLFELDPETSGYHVMLSNIYADAGRWDMVERVRCFMKKQNVEKPPGYSLVELHGEMNVFLVGDCVHPQHKEIYRLLDSLKIKLKGIGYVPDVRAVFHDIDQEEKENNLRAHSEKLAVAFAILNLAPGMTIQIIKNLRICEDCHTFVKLVSQIEKRKIVIRDYNRFHHFEKGSCSCGDYW